MRNTVVQFLLQRCKGDKLELGATLAASEEINIVQLHPTYGNKQSFERYLAIQFSMLNLKKIGKCG